MGKKIVVNLLTKRLAFFEEECCVKEYPVGVGKPTTPTPPGHYHIMGKQKFDRLGSRERDFGSRRMLLDTARTCLHGSWNGPWEGDVSGGCIRMNNPDIEELFNQVELETPVIVIGG